MVTSPRLLSHDTRKFAKEYELLQMIGKGSFGEVWLCRDRTNGEKLAGKLIDKATLSTFAEREDVQREIAILQAFAGKHRGVVHLKEVCEGETVVQLVMELCTGGDLFELLKEKGALPESVARVLFRQLASAMAFCHSQGVVHRDIKPENILLDSPGQSLYDVCPYNGEVRTVSVTLKLADFGLAAVLGADGETSGYTGSRYYTAPEMLKGWMYGRGVDVWSMGVVLCTMLTGRLPFAGQNKQDVEGLRRAIVRGKINFSQPSWLKVSEAAKDLVQKMLTVDPASRLTSEQILKHPWLCVDEAKECPQPDSPIASQMRIPGHVSVSMPSSPVDTHRNLNSTLAHQRPYGSGGAQKMSEFRLCEPEKGAVAAAERGEGPLPAPQHKEEGTPGVQRGARGGAIRDLALRNGGVDSSIRPHAMCCAGPLGLRDLADVGVCGLWWFPSLLGVLGMGSEVGESEHKQELAPKTKVVTATVLSSPGAPLPPVTSCQSSQKEALKFRLGEMHKCMAPRQEFYVR